MTSPGWPAGILHKAHESETQRVAAAAVPLPIVIDTVRSREVHRAPRTVTEAAPVACALDTRKLLTAGALYRAAPARVSYRPPTVMTTSRPIPVPLATRQTTAASETQRVAWQVEWPSRMRPERSSGPNSRPRRVTETEPDKTCWAGLTDRMMGFPSLIKIELGAPTLTKASAPVARRQTTPVATPAVNVNSAVAVRPDPTRLRP
mmetsp:Transcript_16801/g.39605  ORF Transcript_16801/g.39605 Transcript_16801/m.39605 type:complete len:205 (-) Transcript_16801:2163-2777(-)